MTDSEILATGELCEALLASANFKTVVAQYELSIASDILATKADQKERREELYHSLYGARGLLNYMELNVRAASSIKNPEPIDPDTTAPAVFTDVEYDAEGFELRVNQENDY